HPRAIVRPGEAPRMLVTLERRLDLLRQHGAERVLVVPFNREFAALEPEVFVRQVLVDMLRVRCVYVGYSFRFGRGGRGTPALLREVGEDLGLAVRQLGPVTDGGRMLSSTAIRRAL